MSTSVTFNGTSYSIPASGELNWSALSNFLIDVGQHAALSTSGIRALRVATTTPVTVSSSTDYAVVTKLAAPGAVAVTLPAGVAGQIFVIHDGTGDAASNNITITPNGAETINGSATRALSHNRGAITLQYSTTGTDWKVTDEFYPSATIVNADVASGAAIAYSKLNLSASVATGDLASGLLVPVGKGGTGLTGGTSGGVPYFDSASTVASSGALTSAALVLGGGAGAAPTSLALGTANRVLGMTNAATGHEYKTVTTDGTGSDVGVTHTANTITINLPSAGSSTRGLVTTSAQTMTGVKTFTNGINVGGSDLTTFTSTSQATTFTDTGTSPGTSSSQTLHLQRVGDWVTIHIPAFSFTVGSGTVNSIDANTAMPSGYRPASTSQFFSINVMKDNGGTTTVAGIGSITTAGIVSLRRVQAGAWTASSSCGLFQPVGLCYYVGSGS